MLVNKPDELLIVVNLTLTSEEILQKSTVLTALAQAALLSGPVAAHTISASVPQCLSDRVCFLMLLDTPCYHSQPQLCCLITEQAVELKGGRIAQTQAQLSAKVNSAYRHEPNAEVHPQA